MKHERMYEVDGKRVPTWNPFVGCEHDCNYCLIGDTRILMADYSWQTISSIKKDNKIITISEYPKNGRRRIEIAEVVNLFSRNANCIEVTTKHSSITGSAEHPVFVNSGRWQKLSNLKLDWDLNLISLPVSNPDENELYMKGYITGITEGDGTVSFTEKEVRYSEKQRYWRVALINMEILKRLQKYLKKLNINLEINFFGNGKNHPLFKLETRKYDVLVEIKNILGTTPDIDFKKGFLAGIYDAEGSFETANLRISNYDPKLRKKIIRYGQDTSLNFYEEIYDGYCRGIRLRGGQFEIIRFFSITNPTKKKYISLKRLVLDPIQSIKYVGMHDVFNLETTSHTYIANGYAVHNCYASTIAKRQKHRCQKCYDFIPHSHLERLQRKFKEEEIVFVCSMGDISFTNEEEIAQIFTVMYNHPQTTFLIQSKNPKCFWDWLWTQRGIPNNAILGTTIETNRDTHAYSKAPSTYIRKELMSYQYMYLPKYVTIEPIMKFDLDTMVEWIKEINPEFVYIGYNSRDSKNKHLPEPSLEKTKMLIQELEKITEVRSKLIRKAWWEKE